jgi:glucose/arabinose dehydrogenase
MAFHRGSSIAHLATWAALLVSQVAAQCQGITSRYQPKMAAGYKVSALATGLRQPRGIVVDTAGNLLVAEQTGGNVKRLVIKDQGDTVCVDTTTSVLTGGVVSDMAEPPVGVTVLKRSSDESWHRFKCGRKDPLRFKLTTSCCIPVRCFNRHGWYC